MQLKPLSGIRVLDFTAMPPGGACTVMLADLGAEVIRIESPAQEGKPSLVIGQVALSRGKRSITLDVRNPASAAVLLRLAPAVDVVVENAKPGSMGERGFGYEQARARNPRLVWCAITGFGQSGPYVDHAGHDLSYLAHSGLLGALSVDPSWHPGTMIAVPAGAHAAVIAIQAALLQRARTGQGAFLDISLSEAAGWFLTCAVNPLSQRPYHIAPTPDRRLYACADGRSVAVACAEPRTWGALCEGLGVPELKDRLHKPEGADQVTQQLAGIFRSRPAADWLERLAPKGAAVAIVNRATEVLADAHVVARGSVVDCVGTPVPANPARIAAPDGQHTGTATEGPHRVGQDTDEVLAAAGFSVEEIKALADAGIV